MMERGIFALLRAINYEKAPCEECPNYIRCFKGKLACETFRGYVDGGEQEAINPTRKIYKEIFNGRPGIA